MKNTSIKLCVPLRKYFALLCGLTLGTCFSFQAQAQQIVFDISRNQPVFLHDDSYAGSSIFANSLHLYGYRVSVNQLPLNDFLANNKPDLLVLTPTVFQSHANEEVIAVRNYVQSGGKLLVFAEHENFFKSTDNLNRFIEGSGIKILSDKAEQATYNHFAEQFRPRAITPFAAKDSVIFFFPATLELKDSTHSTAKTIQGQHLAAISPFGSGKIGVITDFEIIWNMTRLTGYRYGQNDFFVLKMIESLIGTGTYPRQSPQIKKKNIWLNRNCFESDLNKTISYKPLINELTKLGYGIHYLSVMYLSEPAENDIYIGLCPCESEYEMNFVLKFKQVFIAGFNKSDFWDNITSAFEGFREKGFDTKPMEEKLKSLWEYDEYQNKSWQDSLEIALGMMYSHKFSYTDSIHHTKSPIKLKEIFANYPVAFNMFFYENEYEILLAGNSGQGVYYPAPFENNISLTKGYEFTMNYPIVVSIGNRVVSGAPALFRSDYPDKEFQEKAIKKIVEVLTK